MFVRLERMFEVCALYLATLFPPFFGRNSIQFPKLFREVVMVLETCLVGDFRNVVVGVLYQILSVTQPQEANIFGRRHARLGFDSGM